jgi:hypothetical protein
MKLAVIIAAFSALVLLTQSARAAEQVGRETEITELRLGQRILVDDGSCPSGQIKEVSGAQLSQNGVVRVVRCVPRPGARR